MTGDESVELWLNQYKMKALEKALGEQNGNVKSKMQELLDKLYKDMVPKEAQEQIDAQLHAEYEADRAAAEANRRFVVFRVREHNEEVCFLVDSPTNFLDAATTFRNYNQGTRNGTAKCFADCYPRSLELSPDALRQYLSERLDNSGRVTGVFDFDIDAGTVAALGEDNAWHTYRLKDVSVAAYYANRKQGVPYLQRSNMFLDTLAVRELKWEAPEDPMQNAEPMWPQGPTM